MIVPVSCRPGLDRDGQATAVVGRTDPSTLATVTSSLPASWPLASTHREPIHAGGGLTIARAVTNRFTRRRMIREGETDR